MGNFKASEKPNALKLIRNVCHQLIFPIKKTNLLSLLSNFPTLKNDSKAKVLKYLGFC